MTSIGFLGIASPLAWVWLVFLGVTMAHYYLGITVIRSFDEVLETEHRRGVGAEDLTGEFLFQEIRSQNTVFLRGILKRSPTAGGRLYRMSWRDPTTVIFIGLCLLDYLAILPWHQVDGRVTWTADPGALNARDPPMIWGSMRMRSTR